MKRFTCVIILVLILLGISVWIDSMERKSEKTFSSEGIQIRVLEAEAKGGLTKIIEPNGELSLFSDGVKRKELSRIARKQETLMCKVDYFYHRIKRFIKKKLTHEANRCPTPPTSLLARSISKSTIIFLPLWLPGLKRDNWRMS